MIIRLPFFFTSVINRGESTYILVAQSVLDGYLPYTKLWVAKGPLAFSWYVIFISCFGKSITAIRFGGVLCIFFAACVIWKLGGRLYNEKTGIISAIILVLFSSILPGYGAVMTEHFTLLPSSLILFYLLTKSISPRNCLMLGLLVSNIVLIREEMAFVGLAVMMPVLFFSVKPDLRNLVACLFAFAAGIFCPIIVVMAIYATQGQLHILYKSSVVAQLAYSATYYAGFIDSTILILRLITKSIGFSTFILWFAFTSSSILPFVQRGNRMEKKITIINFLLFLACIYSIIRTGAVSIHHLIKLIPFIAFGSSYYAYHFFDWSKKKISLALVMIGFAITVSPLYEQCNMLLIQIRKEKSVQSDTGYKIARYLLEKNVSGKYIFLVNYHIAYWITGAKIPTKYAHPSDLLRAFQMRVVDGENTTPATELKSIFAKKPVFIAKPIRCISLNKNDIDDELDSEIKAHYLLDKKIDEMYLYRRI